MASVVVKRGRDRRLRAGHPWIYAGEIERVEGDPAPGDIVDIRNTAGYSLGRGYFNPKSQITVRRLTEHDEGIDAGFFGRRFADALRLRQALLPGATSYRLIYGEGDLLPGLIVDKYEDTLVLQVLSLGIDVRKQLIVDELVKLLSPACVYERSDVPVRRLEGLEETRGVLYGEPESPVRITENGLHFLADIAEGQKTGYFFDQKLNRAALAPYVRDARLLDAFCYTGSFSVHAASYGAREVTGLDVSEGAVAMAARNAAENGLSGTCRFEARNGFDALRAFDTAGERFNTIILDPPAFTKSRHTVEGALRGYKEINLRALKLLEPGGYLITCSCSHHMDEVSFRDMVEEAAFDAHRRLREVEWRTQAPDHPIIVGIPETKYLKFGVYQAL